MKRSKMIKEIVKVLKEWEGSELNSETARQILDKVEQLGMAPPIFWAIKDNRSDPPYRMPFTIWEKEKSRK